MKLANFVSIILLIPSLLLFLNIFLGKDRTIKVKDLITNVYISMDGLSARLQALKTIDRLYCIMATSRRKFYFIFIVLCLIVGTESVVEHYINKNDGVEKATMGFLTAAEDQFFETSIIDAKSGKSTFFEIGKSICYPLKDVDIRQASFVDIFSNASDWKDFFRKTDYREIYSTYVATIVVCSILTVLPLLFSLWISFRFTLLLIRSIIYRNVSFMTGFLSSTAISFVFPPLLISIVILAYWIFSWIVFQHLILIDLEHVGLRPLILDGIVIYMFETNERIRNSAADFLFLKEIGVANVIWAQIVAIAHNSADTIKDFFIDSREVLHGNFSQGLVRSLINWCILIDLSFSTSFVWSALFIVSLNRYKIFREGCQNILQYIVDSTDAPLVVFATSCGIVAALVQQLGK